MVQDREIPESALSGKVSQIEYGWQTHHESFVCSSLCYLAPHGSVSPLSPAKLRLLRLLNPLGLLVCALACRFDAGVAEPLLTIA